METCLVCVFTVKVHSVSSYQSSTMSLVSANDACPPFAPFFGYLGCVACIVLGNIGAAMGTYKSAVGIFSMAVKSPEGMVKNMISVIMSGVISIYCLIVTLVIASYISPPTEQGYSTYSLFSAFAGLSAGLCCGLCGLASGWATGVVGDVGARAYGARFQSNQLGKSRYGGGRSGGGVEGDASKLFIASVTIMSFAGATALYGFIMALIMIGATSYSCGNPLSTTDDFSE